MLTESTPYLVRLANMQTLTVRLTLPLFTLIRLTHWFMHFYLTEFYLNLLCWESTALGLFIYIIRAFAK